MFLALFAVFIRVFTSFQSLVWGLVFLIFALIVATLFLLISKKGLKIWSKLIGLIFGAWFIALLSCQIFWRNNAPEIGQNFWTFWWQKTREEPKMQSLVGDFQILEQSKQDRYIVKSVTDNKVFTLKTSEPLVLWDIYFIGASQKSIDRDKTYAERFFHSTSGDRFDQMADFLSYEFSYEKRMLMKGYQGALYPKFIVKKSAFEEKKDRILTARSWVRSQISDFFSPKEWALLLGMLIGDKSQLSNSQYQQFVDSGIVHIIAVSGGNLVMIVVFLSAVLFFLPFYLRNAVIICGVVAFALIAGGDSSVVRALIMSVLSLLALFRGREVKIWRLMSYAFVLMLCYNPYFLSYDLGFLLSFGALVGILAVSERYTLRQQVSTENPISKSKKDQKVWLLFLEKLLKEYGLPTFGASLGTLPILLFFVGSTNLTGILINLFVVPLVPVITIGGFVSLILSRMTGWSFWTVPIEWLLQLVFWLSQLAEDFAVKILVESMLMRRVLLLILIGVVLCILLIVREKRASLLKGERS